MPWSSQTFCVSDWRLWPGVHLQACEGQPWEIQCPCVLWGESFPPDLHGSKIVHVLCSPMLKAELSGTCFHCPDHENEIMWIDFVTSRRVTLRRWLSRCACVREAEGRGKPWLLSLWVASGWPYLVRPHRWKMERRICAGCSLAGMIPTTLSSICPAADVQSFHGCSTFGGCPCIGFIVFYY
jgi:hypothetical protein